MTREKDKNCYNEIYKSGGYGGAYLKKAKNVPIYSTLWEKVANLVSNSGYSKVIDFGCGPGQFAEIMNSIDSDVKYVGYDFSDVAIARAQSKKISNCEFSVRDLYKYSLDEGIEENHAYVCLEVLEHLEGDLSLLEKIPKGKTLFFSVPNYDSTGHVRVFKNQKEVTDRYGHMFELEHQKTISWNNSKNKIFIYSAIKR